MFLSLSRFIAVISDFIFYEMALLNAFVAHATTKIVSGTITRNA